MKRSPSKPCLANRRGGALLFAMLAAPVMIGLAGLGIESGMARVQQSRIKNALDASAIAGIQLAHTQGAGPAAAARIAEHLGRFNLRLNGPSRGRVEVTFETQPNENGGEDVLKSFASIREAKYPGMLGALTPVINWAIDEPRSAAARPPIDISIVVSMSPSMSRVEGGANQITYVQQWINAVADRLDPGVDRVAIVVYSAEADIVRPLSRIGTREDLNRSVSDLMDYWNKTRADSIIIGQQRANLAEGIATARWDMNRLRDANPGENRSRYMMIMTAGEPDMIRADFVNPRTVNPGSDRRWYPWNIENRTQLIYPDSPYVSRPYFRSGYWLGPEPDLLQSRWSPLKTTGDTRRPPYYGRSVPRRVYAVAQNGYDMFETTDFLKFKGATVMKSNCSPDSLTDPSKPDKNSYVSPGGTRYLALRTTNGTDANGEFLPPNGTGEHDPLLINTLGLRNASISIPGDFLALTGLGGSAAAYRSAPKDNTNCLDNMGLRDSDGNVHFDLWGEVPPAHQSLIDERFEADLVSSRPIRNPDGSTRGLEVLAAPKVHRLMGFKPYPALWDVSALNYYLPIIESDLVKAADGDNITIFTVYMETWTYANKNKSPDVIECPDTFSPLTNQTPFCRSTATGGYHNFYCKLANDPMILRQSGNPLHIFKDVYRFSSGVTDERLLNPASNFREDQSRGRFVYTVKQTEALISEFGDQVKVRLVE
jgi:hypothetical protein